MRHRTAVRPVRQTAAMLVAAALALTTAGACDQDQDGIPLSELDEAAAAAWCDYLIRCGDALGDDAAGLLAFAGTAERCRQAITLMGDEFDYSPLVAAQARGTIRYDDQAVADCYDLIAGASCTDDIDYLMSVAHPECANPFGPTLSPGSPCHIDEECIGGWCDTSSACPGVCVAFAAPGTECGWEDRCSPGYDCEGSPARCTAETAEPVVGAGESCEDAQCGSGLYCDEGNVCRQRTAEGVACRDTDECAAGLFCGGTPPGRTCLRPVLVDSVGDGCSATVFCDPLAGLTCNPTTLRCVALPGAGQPCAETSFFLPCATGLVCITGLCEAPRAEGAACTRAEHCASEQCVDDRCAPADPCD